MTDEIASFVGLARDHAILGLYPESISMFEQAILAIDKNKDSDSN